MRERALRHLTTNVATSVVPLAPTCITLRSHWPLSLVAGMTQMLTWALRVHGRMCRLCGCMAAQRQWHHPQNLPQRHLACSVLQGAAVVSFVA